ncbi:MAG: fibronectin type III-like domain-contianing protein, partial [Clostridia bacterium]|nr:fibronectin type III-like domain-contianing protein [Clostridia bacterium]
FKKVILRPGETRKVTIPFDKYTFRYFNSEKNAFAVESGLYKIFVASSSEDIRLAVSTHVNGDGATAYPDVKMLPSYESGRVEEVSDGEFSVLLKRDYVKEDFVFIKKKRILIGENSCFFDLKYSRSLLGRIIGRIFAKKYKKALKKKDFKKLNDLAMVANTPMRAIGIFGKLTRRQTEGLITLFNGKFFKGVGMLLSKK